MKKKSYDIALLLVVLLLFSASLGVLHGRKTVPTASTINVGDDVARIILTKEDALDYLDPLLLAANIDAIARILHQFDDKVFSETLDVILDEEGCPLTPEQKIQFLLACIVHDPKREKQNIIITKLADKFAEYPVLYDAIGYYNAAIPPILAWAKRHDIQKIVPRWIARSLDKAIDEGSVDGLKSLIAHGIRPTRKQASELLQRVVLESRPPEFVAILVKELGANPNYSPDKKRTVLMEAVEKKNAPMVRALLRVGGRPDLILDSAVGSAKQLSFQKGYASIDLILSGLKKKKK